MTQIMIITLCNIPVLVMKSMSFKIAKATRILLSQLHVCLIYFRISRIYIIINIIILTFLIYCFSIFL